MDMVLNADMEKSEVKKRWEQQAVPNPPNPSGSPDGEQKAAKRRKKGGDDSHNAAVAALGDARRRLAIRKVKEELVEPPKTFIDF